MLTTSKTKVTTILMLMILTLILPTKAITNPTKRVRSWLTRTCRCHRNAYCSHVGDFRYRCRCRPGFTGDGFIDGEGCHKTHYDFGNIEIDRRYPNQFRSLHLSSTQNNQSKSKVGVSFLVILIITSFISVILLAAMIWLLLYFVTHCWRNHNKQSQISLVNLKSPFLKVSYDMLLKATNRFSNENLVGVGHFGSVYKGVLDLEKNTVVAVKIISLDLKGATKSFMTECEVLRYIRHRNLLKVITACSGIDFHGNDFKALVYEFMSNGNLQQWIYNDQHAERALNLLQRVNIAIDIACALDYLHNSCNYPIVHCDLKPANVLLDNNMVAHVGDFGLAGFHLLSSSCINNSSVAIKGTIGYAPPEYGLGSRVSKEGDIYSYGIMLIEMMVAEPPTASMFKEGLDLHKYVKKALFKDRLSRVIDPRLLDDSNGARNGVQDENSAANVCKMKCIKSLIKVGLKCSVDSPQNRIKIEDAIKDLQVTKDTFLKELCIINRYMY